MSADATDALSSALAGMSAEDGPGATTASGGDLDPVAVDAGRLAGRVEVLLWAQSELQVELDHLRATDRFADTRGLENFLARVKDSLLAVQDGTGAWAGLVRSAVEAARVVGAAAEAVPDEEMGG